MLLFSFITLPGTLFQLLVRVNPTEALVLELVDWAVISAFILEYVSEFYLATSRSGYAKSPWNVLNLFIILLAFGGALAASPILYSAPLLRTIRVTKLFAEVTARRN